MNSSAAKQEKQLTVRQNEQKWTAELWKAGWLGIPTIIIQKQKELGLDSRDINILLHLISYWWYRDTLPHPSKRRIADSIGVTMCTVRRHIKKMEERGLITRITRKDDERGQRPNFYDFSGLIAASVPHAREATQMRERHREENDRRRMGKRPRLTVVGSSKTVKP
jgi:hypothetical protein